MRFREMHKVFFSLFLFFLTAVFGTLELQIGAPDFKNLPIWRIGAVSSAFPKVFM